jgi:hypothetical protein
MTGGENRRRSIVKALRKRRIDNDIYGRYSVSYYDNLHQYSKNKIHCSCPMCSSKTRNKGNSKRHGMTPSINYKISDIRKIQRLEYEE